MQEMLKNENEKTINALLDEAITGNAKWLEAENALKVALINAGVLEDDSPSKIESILNVILKTANQGVNRIFEII